MVFVSVNCRYRGSYLCGNKFGAWCKTSGWWTLHRRAQSSSCICGTLRLPVGVTIGSEFASASLPFTMKSRWIGTVFGTWLLRWLWLSMCSQDISKPRLTGSWQFDGKSRSNQPRVSFVSSPLREMCSVFIEYVLSLLSDLCYLTNRVVETISKASVLKVHVPLSWLWVSYIFYISEVESQPGSCNYL